MTELELTEMLRPVGEGVALDVPERFRAVIKSIALFDDGSVGILWTGAQLVTFSSANQLGEMESITSDVVMIGRVLYVKAHR